jgi:hypothetical protein
MEDMNGITWK